MTNIKKVDEMLSKNAKIESKVKAFDELLDGLSSTDDQKKALWREIYENATSDRERASILYTEVYKSLTGTASDHVTLGTIMTKYLERMCKSNAQILSLAELIAKAEQQAAQVDSEDLFSKINGI